ncbi:polysaccharide biosynthesis/export family protein [Brevundimonas goettingensis]|uniref:Polysaccharide biosynthesis/export family protein n=1 Tax=Brevundimonas goettingensis TaxID=2774190 RepID=A0A975GWH2_9CAUL|nr:polysaccharide biosynthesis/export family protein [Brevundimonas goettingensis]QTC91838.1 polysaccharide biosynthesis/export family protein [Brevundimonas goettingensis]
MALKRLLPLLLLGACGTTQDIRPVEREPQGFAPWSESAPGYRLGVGDRLKIDFLMTPEMGQEAAVEPDGFISLRATGRVEAQNRTAAELQAAVAAAAEPRLRHPVVTLSVTEARAARIIVGGAVSRPGVYPLPARASTLEAVMLAGGFSSESRMDQVVIIRQRPDGAPMLRTVDLRRFVSNGAPGESLMLASEDIVFVPRSRVAEVNLWIDQYVNRMLPFSRNVSYANSLEGVR